MKLFHKPTPKSADPKFCEKKLVRGNGAMVKSPEFPDSHYSNIGDIDCPNVGGPIRNPLPHQSLMSKELDFLS